MKITLTKTIPINVIHANLSISRPVKRLDYLAVLQLFMEYETVSEKIVKDELLEKLPTTVSRRILNTLTSLGLIERTNDRTHSYRLTQQGEEAVESEEVFLPEEGSYNVTMLDNKHVRHFISEDLKIIKIKTNDKNDLKNGKPYLSRKYLQNNFHSPYTVLFPENEYSVIKISPFDENNKCIRSKSNDADLEWAIDFSNGQITHSLTLIWNSEEKELSMDKNKISVDKLLSEVFSKNLNLNNQHSNIKWNKKGQIYQVDFEYAKSKSAQYSFKINGEISNTELHEYGRFNTCRFDHVPIMPMDIEEAYKWAKYLFIEMAKDTYITATNYTSKWDEISTLFPTYSSYLSRYPEREELLEDISQYSNVNSKSGFNKLPDEYWHLVAPKDLRF